MKMLPGLLSATEGKAFLLGQPVDGQDLGIPGESAKCRRWNVAPPRALGADIVHGPQIYPGNGWHLDRRLESAERGVAFLIMFSEWVSQPSGIFDLFFASQDSKD
jgi:hypothetical protein